DPRFAYGNSKFGFAPEALPDVARFAADLGLEIDELHVHVGWGLQESARDDLANLYRRLAELAEMLGGVRTVNVGGGLCWRQQAEERPLSLETWASLLEAYLAPIGRRIACEPGTYPLASAGLLVAEVNTVEQRGEVTWLGVDAGQNVNTYAAHYGIPH